jgi:hypothetical protein
MDRILYRRRKRPPLPAPAVAAASPRLIQPRLRIGSADSSYEREADATADRVMAMAAPALQRKCDQCEEEELQAGLRRGDLLQRQPEQEEEEEELQAKPQRGELLQRQPEQEEEEEELQAKSRRQGGEPGSDLSRRLHRRQGGAPLPAAERAFFEPRFGADFSAVRVHSDAAAAELSERINARAFTVGSDIYFNRGEYRPGDFGSRHLLAHELTHTLQQGASRQRSNGPGAAPGQVQRRVVGSRVSCEAYPRSYPIFQTIRTDDPTGTLQTAVTRALALLDDAIATLRHGRERIIGGAPAGWPTVSDAVGVSLRDRLRIDPDSAASWTGRGPRTVHHAIRWYRNIRRILGSDFMHYSCIDPACEAGDYASVFAGESRIYLCRLFWESGVDLQAITLIHEASHIYYDTEDSGRGMGSAYCLENFICDINGLAVCEGC